MNSARLSITRPVFIGCLVILMVIIGMIGFSRMGVDLFPPIDFPVVMVTTTYSGAVPEEIESLITKPIEEQVSTISGIKRLTSYNMEGFSVIVTEFTYETDVRYAEEKMREKVSLARNNLPDDLDDEPMVKQFDFTDLPIITMAVMADLKPTDLYDLAKERVKPMLEQVNGVGEVKIIGGTRREIQVELDRNKLYAYEIPATMVSGQLKSAGANVPVGKVDKGEKSTLIRTIGEFTNIDQIAKTVVSFSGDVASGVPLKQLAVVRDAAEEAKSKALLYYPVEEKKKQGVFDSVFSRKKKEAVKHETRQCILLDIYKQSGTNSVSVADGIEKRLVKINTLMASYDGNPRIVKVYDTAKSIRANVDDVKETMIIGILLAVLVVYLFLGNVRSTIITGIAIPNSIFGAFVIMYFMGFTINLMTLLALSLTVGLLVDDAIVVRENIFRKLEKGLPPLAAAEEGTKEVTLAVVATTLTIIAVFLPIGFLEGVIGRFFKQFGLTVVFAMCISLFDALTVAPLLSGYFAGKVEKGSNIVVRSFERFQDYLTEKYSKIIRFSLDHPVIIIIIVSAIFFGSIGSFSHVKKTFQADPDEGEFLVNIQMPQGTSLDGTEALVKKIMARIQTMPELDHMTVQAGNDSGEYYKGQIGVFMVPRSERKRTTNELKIEIRNMLKEFAFAQPTVDNYTRSAGGNKPYMLNIAGENLDILKEYTDRLMPRIAKIPELIDVTTSYIAGKPEYQIQLDEDKLHLYGITNRIAGGELRFHVDGNVVGKLHDKGLEYDVRLRMRPDQRDLKQGFYRLKVPNIQNKLIPLSAVAKGVDKTGPSRIIRQDRSRVIQIYANLAPGGAVGSAINITKNIMEKEMPLPKGVTYSFIGQADAFADMVSNILVAFFLSLVFIYLVLSSLYESFITPFTILLALPPAMSGAFLALFITGKMMDMNCMIGVIMLLGLVTKNSILLVDFALHGVREGMSRKEAITRAGMIRLRPILMTTFAMLAGMLPVALGIGEAAKYRSAMGVAIIGGLVISTLITLVVVPAVFEYIDMFREWIESRFRPDDPTMLEDLK